MFVKLLNVFNFGGIEIFEISVKIVRVGIGVEGFSGQIDSEEKAIGLIHHVYANFFFHHVSLIFEILGRKIERLHAVGFEPEQCIQSRQRSGLNVFGKIVARIAVESAAAAFRHAVKDALGRNRRALEHHVFEEMREARAALRLKAKSDAVADANSESRRGMIFGNHDGQAVRQLFHRSGRFPLLSLRGKRHEQYGTQSEQEKRMFHNLCLSFLRRRGSGGLQ